MESSSLHKVIQGIIQYDTLLSVLYIAQTRDGDNDTQNEKIQSMEHEKQKLERMRDQIAQSMSWDRLFQLFRETFQTEWRQQYAASLHVQPRMIADQVEHMQRENLDFVSLADMERMLTLLEKFRAFAENPIYAHYVSRQARTQDIDWYQQELLRFINIKQERMQQALFAASRRPATASSVGATALSNEILRNINSYVVKR